MLRYPLRKLTDSDDWFCIEIYSHKPGQFSGEVFSAGEQSTGSLKESICLPMPWNIPNNSQSVQWGESTISPLAAAVGEVAQATINNGAGAGFESVKKNANDLKNLATKGSNIQTLTTGLAGLAAAQLGGLDPGQALSRFAGVTFNNNVELAFSGVSIRPASQFTFDLTPRNSKESAEISKIIKVLKSAMSASKGSETAAGGIFLSVPDVFKIKYMKGGSEHPFLNKFKICALNALSVDLSPNGYATYDDATPVQMVMSLSFQELVPIYKDNYKEHKNSSHISY